MMIVAKFKNKRATMQSRVVVSFPPMKIQSIISTGSIMQIKSLFFSGFILFGLLTTSSNADVIAPSLWDDLSTAYEFTLSAETLISGLNNDRLGNKSPKEAMKACEGKNEGDSCQFEKRNGKEVTGTCQKRNKNNDQLVCKPGHKGGKKTKEGEKETKESES